MLVSLARIVRFVFAYTQAATTHMTGEMPVARTFRSSRAIYAYCCVVMFFYIAVRKYLPYALSNQHQRKSLSNGPPFMRDCTFVCVEYIRGELMLEYA